MRTIFKNGTIYRGNHANGFNICNTMVIDNDRIEYLGDDPYQRIPDLDKHEHQIIDLQGRSMSSSFMDGHMHLLQFGASLVKVALDDCRSLEDIRSTIAEAARSDPYADRILCRGWRQSSTNRQALASMIDDLDTRSIFIDADDLHSVWCNSAALKELGVDRDTPDPEDGIIERDENGDPTGLIAEGVVFTLVWPYLIGTMSPTERAECIRTAIKEYHASGYTAVIEMAMDAGIWRILEDMHQRERLSLRIAAHWIISSTGDDLRNFLQVQEAIDMHKRYNLSKSPDFRIAGIKIICDGVVDSCTAALSKPYLVSPHGKGGLNWTPDALHQVASKADAAGLQIAFHAIGDAAINLAINTLEHLGTTGRRHRIEHLELTHPDDAERLGKLGITASVQPVHSDPSILTAWPELIGPERCEWAFAYRDFHDHGAHLTIGTDSPTAPHMPLPNFYVASTRKSSRDAHNHHRFNHRRPLDMNQVINAATWGAAYSCFAEGITGSLDVGKKADFIVIDGLSHHFGSESLLHASVVETWMDGQKVYAKE